MGRRQREEALKQVNLLGLAPIRTADWEEAGGRVVVLRPPPRGRGVRGLLDRFFHRMSARRIRLDEVGSLAWRSMDGKRTAGEVAAQLREAFGERVEPAEERLGHLIRVLRKEGLLAYPGWDGEGG